MRTSDKGNATGGRLDKLHETLEDLAYQRIEKRINALESEFIRIVVEFKEGLRRLGTVEADLCAHSITTRKADDDLAARIGRLESAHQATVPVDAMRRLIEWAYLHQEGRTRERSRFEAVADMVLLWVPEVGTFRFEYGLGFFWQDYAPKEVE